MTHSHTHSHIHTHIHTHTCRNGSESARHLYNRVTSPAELLDCHTHPDCEDPSQGSTRDRERERLMQIMGAYDGERGVIYHSVLEDHTAFISIMATNLITPSE